VRSNPDTYGSGAAIANVVQAALNHPDVSALGYMYWRLEQSVPNYLAQDANMCHHWSVNLELWWDS
jgi:hypothetical protein